MPNAMTIHKALQIISHDLKKNGIDAANTAARALFCHVLQVDKVYLTLHAHDTLPAPAFAKIQGLVARHTQHEPLAYIIGSKEFYGRDFKVNTHTLIPRPETEDMLEAALAHCNDRAGPITFADIGTGSGCIGISLAKELPKSRGIMLDLSKEALAVAKENAHIHGVEAHILAVQGDLRTLPLQKESLDLCISNPPYVSISEYEALEPNVREYEPKSALVPQIFTHEHDPLGLKHIEFLACQTYALLKAGGIMLLEHGHTQGAKVRDAFMESASWHSVTSCKDLSNLDRFCVCKKK